MSTPNNYVVLNSIGRELGLDPSRIRKYAIDHNIPTVKIRTSEGRWQKSLAVTPENAKRLREIRMEQGFSLPNGKAKVLFNPTLEDNGIFYLIQLVPEFCAERIKMGFTTMIADRLASHRVCCPTLNVLKFWPCHRLWEQAAIASITRNSCKKLSPEVYQYDSIDVLLANAEAFFSLMPVQ
jgi:hypothetical protein